MYTYNEPGPFTEDSVYTYQISNIPSDGSPLEVVMYFADEDTCGDTLNFTSPLAIQYNGGTGSGVYCAGDDVDSVQVDVVGLGPLDVHYRFNGTPMIETSTNNIISIDNAEGQYIIDTIFDASCYFVVNDTFDIVINPTAKCIRWDGRVDLSI